MPAPSNSHASGYSFEFPVKVPGAESANFIDLYRRAHFVLESKQFAARREELTALERAAIDSGALAAAMKKSGPVRGTGAWDDAMIRAKGQAERYVRSLSAEALDAHRKRVQAQHPDLTLTGLYNVLEKLRADQPLTDKERSIHGRGLVSILQQLHDDLDAAVFDAYGWGHLWKAHEDAQSGTLFDFKTGASVLLDCDPAGFTAAVAAFEKELDAEILTRLVALNAERAAEEKRGIIHWLRPEYQNKPGKDTTTQDTLDLPEKKRGKKSEVRSQKSAKGNTKPTAKTPWPKSLADRIRATEQALHAAKAPVTATDLTKHFTRAKPHDIQEILESLVTLGRARMEGEERFSA